MSGKPPSYEMPNMNTGMMDRPGGVLIVENSSCGSVGMRSVAITVILAFVVMLLFYVYRCQSSAMSPPTSSTVDSTTVNRMTSGPTHTVFVSKNCGYCSKQKELINKLGHGHRIKYVECTDPMNKGRCNGITAYPTWIHPNGNHEPGYKDAGDVAARMNGQK